MIRRDYILRMIEEFAQALARLKSLKKDQRWNDASETLDDEFKQLIGEGAATITRLSETELLARIMQSGPTHLVHDKTLILTTLLTEAGDVHAAQDRSEESRRCYLKALHLLLDVFSRADFFEFPEFVPKVGLLVSALSDASLSVTTLAMLMQHYERIGEFARAEDALFAVLDAEPDNARLPEFGLSFYERLSSQPDSALTAGNLSRAEIQQGIQELQRLLGKTSFREKSA